MLTAHLLRDHDREGSKVGPANPRYREQLREPCQVVGFPDELALDGKLRMDVEDIASNLDGLVPQPRHRLPGFPVAVLFHIPSRRLRAEVYQHA